MVYIKRLTLQGFKSFGPRRLTLNLKKGLVVVTGPNGGGKSNIMDAIRFALGELSAHNLRVGRMSELVHDKPNVTSVRVSITLDNSDGVLPIDSPEVTITRRMDRNGESEYSLNGRNVSRSELLTLLSMANIKPSGFNIVPQGSVVEIAEMSGVELRRMIEEVAGIGDYEKKRQEAEQQLSLAEKNIAIAKASTSEVRLRVKQLERERSQAYRRRHVEGILNSLKASSLESQITSLEKELREVDSESLALEETLGSLENQRKELGERHGRLKELWEERVQTQRGLEERIRALEEERSRLEAEAGELRVRVSVLEERARRLGEELPYLERRLRRTREATAEASRALALEESQHSERLRLLEEAEKEYREAREAAAALEEEFQRLRTKVEAERRRRNSLRAELRAREKAAKAEIRELGRALERLRGRIQDSLERLGAAVASMLTALEKLEDLESSRVSLGERAKRLEAEAEALRTKLRQAKTLEKRLEDLLEKAGASGMIGGDSEKQRVWEALREAGLQGVLGFLDEEIEADEEGWKLLEAATEGWVHSLVVEGWSLAAEMARVFASTGLSVRIIPLEAAPPTASNPRLKGVKVRSRWAKQALNLLLRETELGNSLTPPTQSLRRVYDGVVLYADGRVEAAADGKRLLGRLLTEEYKRSAKALRRLRELVEGLEAEAEKISREERESRAQLMEIESKVNRLEAEAEASYKAAAEAIVEEIQTLRERERILGELQAAALRVAEAMKGFKALGGVSMEEEPRLGELSERLRKAKSVYEEARVRFAELEARFKVSERNFEELKRREKRLREEAEELEARLEALKKEAVETEKESRVARQRLQEVEEKIQEISRQLNSLRIEREKQRAEAEELHLHLTEIENKLRAFEERFQELSSKRVNLAVRRAQLEGELTRLREALALIGSRDLSLPELPEELRRELEKALEEELKELEMINQLAPQQYEELIGNYKLRSSRIRELEEERLEILRFLEWVESEKRRAFLETFNKISEAFERFFTRLTGGQGWLRLESLENPFEGGVEMILRFPGKSSRNARSASGGEKSVAAVALLLALQGLTPAEFYIFDEVDAHMDLQYSVRLAQLFKEMAERTQIIVISLKDVVAEQADQLIGVYISRGESRAIRAELEEVRSLG